MHLVQPHINRSWSAAARQNWNKLFNALRDQLRIDDVLYGPLDLAFPWQVRIQHAENLISSLANVCGFAPSQHADTLTWASDGSMLPFSAGILDPKMVTGAATGTQTLVTKIPGSNISILHGELARLILALVLSESKGTINRCKSRLLTDHLNTVQLVEDSRTGIDQTARLRFMNGRSYY